MNDRTRKALRSSSMFGGAFAAWSLVKSISSVISGEAPLLMVVAEPAFTFVIFGGGAFVLLMIGVATTSAKSPGNPNISPWFVWLVAGAFAAFWLATLLTFSRDSVFRWGWISAAVWAAGVLVVWAIVRLRRRSGPVQRASAEP